MPIPLTDKQREHLAGINARMVEVVTRANQQQEDLRQQANSFLNYVLSESGADPNKQYRLSDDGSSMVEFIDPTKAAPAKMTRRNKK